jgi:hypothetical protein
MKVATPWRRFGLGFRGLSQAREKSFIKKLIYEEKSLSNIMRTVSNCGSALKATTTLRRKTEDNSLGRPR